MALSERQLTAVRVYMTGKSEAASLRIAGYSESVATTRPFQVFKHPEVMAEIERRRVEIERKNGITVEWILEKIRNIVEDETTTASNKIAALTLLAKHKNMLTDKLDVRIEDDLVQRLHRGRERAALDSEETETDEDKG